MRSITRRSLILCVASLLLGSAVRAEEAANYELIYSLEDPARPVPNELVRVIMTRLQQGQFQATVEAADDKVRIVAEDLTPDRLRALQAIVPAAGDLQFCVLADKEKHAEIVQLASQSADDVLDDRNQKVAHWVHYDSGKIEGLEPNVHTRKNPDTGKAMVLAINQRERLGGQDLTDVRVTLDPQGKPAIDLTLSTRGGVQLQNLTSRHLPRDERAFHLGIILDNHLLTAPRILAAIRDRAVLTGNFTEDEVENLATILRAGSLPLKLNSQPESVRKVP